ncbi:GAP family protein [Microbacterium sp. KNMS]
MDITTIGTLALLALADSTSFGTLLIPLWLLLASSRPRPSRMLAYLATVAGFYLAMGVLLSIGARLLLDGIRDWLASDGGAIAMLVVGGVLLAGAILTGTRKDAGPSPRLLAWRERAVGAEDGPIRPLILLALAATAIEIATLLPYLMAIGIMDAARLPPAAHLGLLASYCLVMVAPALALLVLRMVAHAAVEPLLRRVNAWLTRQAGEMTAWIIGIIGFLLVRAGTSHFGGVSDVFERLPDIVAG